MNRRWTVHKTEPYTVPEEMSTERNSVFELHEVPGVFLRLSFFSLIATMATSLYSVTDAYFIGAIGSDAIAGVSVIFPLLALLGGLGLAFGTGTASWVTRLLGAGDRNRAGSFASSGLVSGAFLLTLVTLVLVTHSPKLLGLMGAEGTVLDHAVDYAQVAIPAAAVTAVNMIMGSLIRSEGSAAIATLGLVVGAVLNVVLDPILIAATGMRSAGAAWATMAAQIATLALYAAHYRGRRIVSLGKLLGWSQRKAYFSILSLGLPALMAQIGIAVVILVLNTRALQFGAPALAAAGVSTRVASAGVFVVLALCRGLHPMIGFYQGANDQARLARTLRFGSFVIGGFAVLFSVGISAWSKAIVGALTHDDAVAALGGPLLTSFVMLFPLYAAQLVMATYWQASGIMGRALVVVLARPIVFLLPALLVFPRLLAFTGLILATPAADLLSGLTASALLVWSARHRASTPTGPTVGARS